MRRVQVGSLLQQVDARSQPVTRAPEGIREPEVFAELSTAYLADVWQFVVEYGRFESEAALLCALEQPERLDRPTRPGWMDSTLSLPTLRFLPGAHRWQGSQLHTRLGGVS